MNKQGFLRILEASIAILIVISVLFFAYNRSSTNNAEDYSVKILEILEEIAKNPSLRTYVLEYESGEIHPEINSFVSERIPQNFLNFEVKICEIESACGLSSFVDGEVYSAERTISSNLEIYSPRKIRIFIWAKS